MVRFATIEDAKLAVAAWGGAASSLIHLGDRGNSVFSFMNAHGKLQILRLTDPYFRSLTEVNAEIEFINRIFMAGVSVAKALPALSDEYTILIKCGVGNLICSSIAFAPGVEVLEGSPYWNSEFFCEWWRNLALIHHASQNFRFDAETPAFDFGNCCYHWFIADIAISLSTVRRKVNRDQIKQEFLSGYKKVRLLPPNLDALLDLFIRLRVVYVYLSRLHLWSHDRTLKQAQELELIKFRVHDKQGW